MGAHTWLICSRSAAQFLPFRLKAYSIPEQHKEVTAIAMSFLRKTVPYVSDFTLQVMEHQKVRLTQTSLFGHRGKSRLRDRRIEYHVTDVDAKIDSQTSPFTPLGHSVNKD